MDTIDWNTIRHLHFVGIKGVAMTSLAIWAKQSGYSVSGSDTSGTFPTDEALHLSGIVATNHFSPEHVTQAQLVVYTGAHGGKTNVEVKQAIAAGIPVYSHGEALGEVTKGKKVIAVAGCHGKTTTTAMIATMLVQAGLDPSYVVGSGMIGGLGLPGHAGTGEYFIVEADEYVTDPTGDFTPRFLWLNPHLLVITRIDFDHPDVYSSLEDVGSAYQKLLLKLKPESRLIWNKDDAINRQFLSAYSSGQITYGKLDADLRILSNTFDNATHVVSLLYDKKQVDLQVGVPGEHNAYNAAAAYLAASACGIESDVLKTSLASFTGASRRFELLGYVNTHLIIDDYAHHPEEIRATLQTAMSYPHDGKVICVFQPHTFSRTEKFLVDFAHSFTSCDHVIISAIYASAREKQGSINGNTLVQEIAKHHSSVFYAPTYHDVIATLQTLLSNNDIIIFMGAGDIGVWARQYLTDMPSSHLPR